MGLETCYLFSRLDNDDLSQLSTISMRRSYARGSVLFYAGEHPKTLRMIESGTVRIFKHDAAGNEIVLTDFGSNDLIAEMAHFEAIPYPATARCESDVTVYEIDFEAFKQGFLSRSEISLGIIRSLTRKIKQLEEVIRRTLIDDAQTRLARYLIEHSSELSRLTQKEIASHIALTPETVSRILRRFKENGWVGVERKRIILKEREPLTSLMAENG